MFNTKEGYSLSDIAAVTGSANNSFDGNGFGGWWIILLFLFAFGGWGNGFGGGAIMVRNASAVVSVENCTFVENVASNPKQNAEGGGAIWGWKAASLGITNCIFHANRARAEMMPAAANLKVSDWTTIGSCLESNFEYGGTTYDFSVVYGAGGGGSDAPMLFYEGGVPHTTGISNQKYQTAELNWITSFTRASIGGGSESQYNYEGRLYSIRLYDCPLSAREIAYNAAVDKVRFDGVAPAEAFNAPDMRWNATSGKVEVFIDLSTLHGDGTLSINGGGASAWVSVGDEVSIVYAPATGEKALEWFGLPDGVAAKLQMLKKIDIARALNADPGIEEGSGSFNDGVNRYFMPVSWNRTHSGAGLGTYSTTSDERGWHYLSPYQGPAFFQEGLALPAGNYTLTFDHAANNTDHTIYSWQLVDTNNVVLSICNVTNEMRIYGTSWHTVQADFTVAEGGIYKLQTVRVAYGSHGNCYSLFDKPTSTSKSRNATRISARRRCGRRSSSATTRATSSRKGWTTSFSTARTIRLASISTTRSRSGTATAMSRQRALVPTMASRARTSASERRST